jgi:hypothetical protein
MCNVMKIHLQRAQLVTDIEADEVSTNSRAVLIKLSAIERAV